LSILKFMRFSLKELTRRRWIPFRIGEEEGFLVMTSAGPRAYSGVCPHLLGPLCEGKIRGEEIICPWHGYRYDLVTGRCLTVPGWGFPEDRRPLKEPAPLTLKEIPFHIEGDEIVILKEG